MDNDNIEQILKEIKSIKSDVSFLKESMQLLLNINKETNVKAEKMEKHIDFINDKYDGYKTSLEFINNKINDFKKNLTINSNENEQIEYYNNIDHINSII